MRKEIFISNQILSYEKLTDIIAQLRDYNIVIHRDAQLGDKLTLEEGVTIGKCKIGKLCTIKANVTISSEVVIQDGVIISTDSEINYGAKIGRDTVIGPKCYIGDYVKIGRNSHLKKQVALGKNCKVSKYSVLWNVNYLKN